MATPPDQLPLLVAALADHDVALGSRIQPDGSRHARHASRRYRRLLGQGLPRARVGLGRSARSRTPSAGSRASPARPRTTSSRASGSRASSSTSSSSTSPAGAATGSRSCRSAGTTAAARACAPRPGLAAAGRVGPVPDPADPSAAAGEAPASRTVTRRRPAAAGSARAALPIVAILVFVAGRRRDPRGRRRHARATTSSPTTRRPPRCSTGSRCTTRRSTATGGVRALLLPADRSRSLVAAVRRCCRDDRGLGVDRAADRGVRVGRRASCRCRGPVRWWIVLLAGLSWPFVYAIKLGQVGPILFLLFAIGWRWLDDPIRLGASVALGTRDQAPARARLRLGGC